MNDDTHVIMHAVLVGSQMKGVHVLKEMDCTIARLPGRYVNASQLLRIWFVCERDFLMCSPVSFQAQMNGMEEALTSHFI